MTLVCDFDASSGETGTTLRKQRFQSSFPPLELHKPGAAGWMSRLPGLVGLGCSGSRPPWPGVKDNGPGLTVEGAVPSSWALGPRRPLWAGSAGAAAGRMDLGHGPVSRMRPGEGGMARRLRPEAPVGSVRPRPRCQEVDPVHVQMTHHRRYSVGVAKALGRPGRELPLPQDLSLKNISWSN